MRENVLPPVSNTGAERTSEEPMRALVDWVRVTFFDAEPLQIIRDVLQMKPMDFECIDRGRYRYKKTYRRGEIALYFDGIEEGMGVLLDMSGEGCRQFEAWGRFKGWSVFFRKCLDMGCNVPRVDIAIDDRKGYFTMDQIERKVNKKEVVSRFKGVSGYEKQSLNDEDPKGKTIMFGSRQSMICVRFYDKLKDLMRKGKSVGDWETWTRVEIEAKNDRAKVIAEHIADGKDLGEMVKGILAHYIRFVVRNKYDSNKRRWKTWRNWERFLGGVEKLKLGVSPEEKTIEEDIQWIKKQVAKTMLKIVMAESMEFVQDLIVNDSVQLKLRPRDFVAIEEHRKKKARLVAEDRAVR